MTIRIDVSYDHVVINGVKVPCSGGTSPSQWLEFWGRVTKIRGVNVAHNIAFTSPKEPIVEHWSGINED